MSREPVVVTARPLGPLGPLLGGVAIAILAALLLQIGGLLLVAVAFGALALVLPSLLFRDVSRYWLFGYLAFLPFEMSVRITRRGVDVEALINQLGVPPTSWLGVKAFPTDLALAALLVWWIAALQSGRCRLRFPPVLWLLVAHLAWSVAGACFAEDTGLAVAQLVHEGKYFALLLFAVSALESRDRLRFVALVLLATVAMESVVSLSMYAAGYSRDTLAERLGAGVTHEYAFLRDQEIDLASSSLRASGTFGAASHLSLYMQLVAFVPLALAIATQRPRQRLALFALFGMSAATIVASLSRAGFLGLAVGSVTCGAVLVLRGHVRPRTLAASLFLGFVAFAAQAPFTYQHLTARPETFWHRFTLFREGGRLIAEHPLLGVGVNNSTVARIRSAEEHPMPPPTGSGVASFDNLYPIHNQFIVVTAETGLVGAALLGAFFLLVARRALGLSASSDRFVAGMAAAMLAGIAAFGAQLTGDHLAANAARSMLWLDVAIVLALERIEAARAVSA